jgi:acyl-CoA thioesterase
MHERIKAVIEGDKIFHLFNMELVDESEGYACVRAEVRETFLNAHRIAHGGLIFALLDVAFALAANSVIEAVGVQWSFNVIRSASLGDQVRAEAKIIHKGKSSLVVELKAYNEKTHRLLAQGMATALPFPRK